MRHESLAKTVPVLLSIGASAVVTTASVSASAQGLEPPPAAPPASAPPGYTPYAQPTTTYPQPAPAPYPGAPASASAQYGQPAPTPYPGSAVTPASGSTNAQLAQSEQDDSGRNFEIFYAKAEIGAAYAGLDSFSSTNLGLAKTSEFGPMFGLGAGLRLLLFTLGARARLNQYADFSLWQLDLEAGFHIPIGRLDPYISLHGGYAFEGKIDASQIGTLPSATNATNDVSVHGFDAGLSVGTDYYLTPFFSLGLDVTGDALFLQRPTVDKPAGFSSLSAADQMAITSNPLYADSGDSVGFGLSGSIHAGLHLGL